MEKLVIITDQNDAVLRGKSAEVKRIDDATRKFCASMVESMIAFDGVGLAAPQVGKSARIIVVTLGLANKKRKIIPMINPKIVFASSETAVDEEGCLSVPGKFDNVRRSCEITVNFLDLNSREQIMKLQDFDARVVQHEIDHLNGILFIDKIEHSLFAIVKRPKNESVI